MEAGPRRTPGVKDRDGLTMLSQRDVDAFRRESTPPTEEPEPKKEPEKTGVIELSREQTTALHLVMTKCQLATSQQKLALMELRDAQASLVAASKDEAIVFARLSAANGLGRIKGVKVVGPNKIAYETE